MVTTFLSAAILASTLLSPSATGSPSAAQYPTAAPPPPTWVAPLEPTTVQRPFVPPAGPYGPGHRGVDLAATRGQSVRAAGPGTVVVARLVAGRWVVSVQHPAGLPGLPEGSWRTTYEGVRPSVSVGAVVSTGDRIGTLVGGGHASGLHWGLKSGRTYRDPLSLIRRPIILKPFSASAHLRTGIARNAHTRLRTRGGVWLGAGVGLGVGAAQALD